MVWKITCEQSKNGIHNEKVKNTLKAITYSYFILVQIHSMARRPKIIIFTSSLVQNMIKARKMKKKAKFGN